MKVQAFPRFREDSARDKVALLFLSATLVMIVLYRHWPDSPLWVPVALGGIALAIWHGAYDTVLANNLWQPRYAGKWLLPFTAAYVGLTVLVVIAWILFPAAAMVAFLLYSGLHFGMETEGGRSPLQRASAIAFGCLPIAAACYWQAGAVVPIFVTMLRGNVEASKNMTTVAGALLMPLILLSLVPFIQGQRDGVRRGGVLVSQLLLFRFCPPVLAFAVFFCVLHTPEHLVETSRTTANVFSVRRMWHNLRAGIGPWLVSLAAVLIAVLVGRRTVQADTGLLFIALSALTVPHMVLAMLATAQNHPGQKLKFRSRQREVHS